MNKDCKKILEILIEGGISPSDFIKSYRKNNQDLFLTIKSFQNLNALELNGKNKNNANGRYGTLGIENDIGQKKYDILNISEDAYPDILKEIYFPPPLLFYKGKRSFKSLKTCIGIVGTRKCSAYGKDVASYFAKELSMEGITIVSGMAEGIDYFSHKSSICEKGGTIAVMGCGIDIIYPPENKKLYNEIVENGIVISEFLPGTPPLKRNFPARNRIISGLCKGVIVVEAGNKSGALITADFALQQNREVFAVPGEIYSTQSRGCHKLIKNGAKLAENIDDIFDEILTLEKDFSYSGQTGNGNGHKQDLFLKKENKNTHAELSVSQQNIYNVIGKNPVSLEEIITMTGAGLKEVLRIIAELIFIGLIEEKNINQYCRL